jgi:predicted Zn finger-like uncharacterized protein
VVVVCEKCETRFHLDDSRVPAKGARVRCSRCKHAFFVRPPGSADADAIEEVVAEVTGPGGGSVPEVAQDLSGSMGAAPDRPRDARPTEHSPESGGSGDFEEDWEFNDESPSDLSGEEEPGIPGIGAFDASGLDLAGDASEPEIAGGGGAPDLAGEPLAPEIPEGGPEAIAPPALDSPPADEPSIDPIASIRAGDAGLDSPVADDLGSPEDWDFVGRGEVESPIEPEPEGDAPQASAPAEDAASSASRTPPLAESDSGEAPAESVGFSLPAPVSHLVSMAAWILVFLGFGMGISTVLDPPDREAAARAGRAEIEVPGLGITAVGVEDRVLENALAGNLLVVSGTLENRGEEPLAPGRPVWVQLVSDSGVPISGATAAAGRALGETRLREREPALLRRDLERSAAEIALRSLYPGERIRFDAVFESIPESATGWVLQAGPSPSPLDPRSSLPPTAPLSWE